MTKLMLLTVVGLTSLLMSQTKVSKNQLRNQPSIVAVEWSTCSGTTNSIEPCSNATCATCPCSTNPGGCARTSSCTGLELYRFKLADGTFQGPFVAVQATPETIGNPQWQSQPVVTQLPGPGTMLASTQLW